jgi:hypothetical protein
MTGRSVARFFAFVLTAIPVLSSAAPVAFDGRFYEVVLVDQITWDAANAAANSRVCGPTCGSLQNVQGHLATINTLPENDKIQTLNVPPGNRTELWIGGFQQSGSTEPGGGWKWLNGETIPVPNPAGSGFGWATGEPSNGPGGAEQHLTFGRNGLPVWNDNDKTNNIYGYVVEYGDKFSPFKTDNCAAGGPGCNLGGALFAGTVNGTLITLPLPEGSIPNDSNALISTLLIKNDAARCAQAVPQQLSLFGGDVILSKSLCGHPDFVVAKFETSGTGFEINQGVVDILNGNEVLAGNLYECQPSGVDPTEADLVGYQSSAGALEKQLQTGIDDVLVGSVGDFTNKCGSSRGSGPGRSYYFAGLRWYPGLGNDAATNPLSNLQFRFKVVTYKLDVLALAVSNACTDKAFSNGVCSSVSSQVKNIKGDITNGNTGEAKAHVKNLQKTLSGTSFKVIAGKNHQGEIISRTDNIAFTINKFFP